MRESSGEQRTKDDLIVITGAGGFIGGALARYFREHGFTRIRAVDKKPLPEWYQRVPGVECSEPRLQRRGELPPRLRRGRRKSTTWRPTWAAWGSSSGFASSACAAF